MSIEDRDAIDRALDAAFEAAEAKQAEQQPAEEEVIQESPSTPAEGQTDQIAEAEALKASGKERDAQGKFQKPATKAPKWQPRAKDAPTSPTQPTSDQAATPETGATDQAQSATQSPTEIPEYWPADLKAVATKAPRELVQHFARHDAARDQQVRSVLKESQRARETHNRLYQDWDQHANQNRVLGIQDPVEELQRFRAADAIIKSDPLAAAARILQQNGLTAHHLMGLPQEQQQPIDPRIEQLRSEHEQIKQTVLSREQQLQEQEEAARRAELQSFMQGRGSRGEVRAENVARFEPQIAQVITILKSENPHMSRSEVLHHAYEVVMGDIYGTFAPAADPQANRAAVIANAQKARNAASSITGGPSTTVVPGKPRLKGSSFKEKLGNAVALAEERARSR